MNQADVEAFVSQLDNVQREDNFDFVFYFVGDDHRLPFVTIGYEDNDYDTVSNLNREGVFRINMGITRQSFDELFDDPSTDNVDYAALNIFMPHPDYAKQNYICILNPTDENIEKTKHLILEAHAKAAKTYSMRNT